IGVGVPDDAVERYTGRDLEGEPIERDERIVLSWFVETGLLKYPRTSYVPDIVPSLADALENEWEPDHELDFSRDTAEVIVVVRDDREGVAWRRARVSLEAAP